MMMYVINKIAQRLEREKAKLEDLKREKESAANSAPYNQTELGRDIYAQRMVVDTLISLLEELK